MAGIWREKNRRRNIKGGDLKEGVGKSAEKQKEARERKVNINENKMKIK